MIPRMVRRGPRLYAWRIRTYAAVPRVQVEADAPASALTELKHHLRSTEVPALRQTLVVKLREAIPHLDTESFSTVNKVFDEVEAELGEEDLERLFIRAAQILISANQLQLPDFVTRLAKHFIKGRPEMLVPVVELACLAAPLDNVLQMVANAREVTPALGLVLLRHYHNQKKLTLGVFEAVGHWGADDEFVEMLISHVEGVFETAPKVHEYKHMERSVLRIQHLVAGLEYTVSSGKRVQLAKFAEELASVHHNDALDKKVKQLINIQGEMEFDLVRKQLFAEDLGDEALAESVLALAAQSNRPLLYALTLYIQSDPVKFSESLRLQCRIYEFDDLEHALFDFVRGQLGEVDAELYTKITQAALSVCEPRGYFTQTLANHMRELGVEEPLYSYKHRLDKAISTKNHIQAINIFDDSVHEMVEWRNSPDPLVAGTLNRLIVLVCETMHDINAIFPIFSKIKRHMASSADAQAITALAKHMLAAEYVGDLIEMLKRELPPIKKEDTPKISLGAAYMESYRRLFEVLHNFCISYDNEPTHETNWVLYGELHTYFEVPFDTYLPAMKFFCGKDRLHASLVIFRQIKRLSELHGTHHFPPPSRDMYMYLFQVYGDKLYEEGIVELHEYLKMDVALPKQDIGLQNALLNAYSNLQDVPKARDLFLSMSANPKLVGGVNEETIQIMIKTLTYADLVYVKEFWNNLSLFGVVPDYPIFRQYLIAHVYHGRVDDALALTAELDDYGLDLSSDTLLALHNYCLEEPKQKVIAKWAKEHHPELWSEAQSTGLLRGASGYEPDSTIIGAIEQ